MAIRTKAGRLFLDFRWKGVRCREFIGLADTTENRRRLRGFDQAITGEIALGTFDYRKHFPHGTRLRDFYSEEDERVELSSERLVARYLTEWHKRRSPFRRDGSVAEGADLHPSTWIHDESIIRYHLVPAFGKLRLDELTSAHCKDFRKALQDKGRSGKTAQNVLGVLHKAMADAVEDGIVTANPVPRLRRKTAGRVSRSNSDPLTVAEVKDFLASVPGWYRDLYDLWFRVGWRPSEILAIRFDWIDFKRRIVSFEARQDCPLGRG